MLHNAPAPEFGPLVSTAHGCRRYAGNHYNCPTLGCIQHMHENGLRHSSGCIDDLGKAAGKRAGRTKAKTKAIRTSGHQAKQNKASPPALSSPSSSRPPSRSCSLQATRATRAQQRPQAICARRPCRAHYCCTVRRAVCCAWNLHSCFLGHVHFLCLFSGRGPGLQVPYPFSLSPCNPITARVPHGTVTISRRLCSRRCSPNTTTTAGRLQSLTVVVRYELLLLAALVDS